MRWVFIGRMSTVAPGPGAQGAAVRRSAAAVLATALALVALPRPAAAQEAECVEPSRSAIAAVPWPQESLAYDRAWDLTRGADVLVAVVDTGVDARVPQLLDRVAPGPDLVGDGEGPTFDCAGHGTFLAGIVAGAPTPGLGFAGMAPEARVLAVRHRDGRQSGVTAPVGPAIRAAADAGAGVVLLGAPLPYGDAAALDAVLYAGQRDALVVTPGLALPRGSEPPTELPGTLVSVGAQGGAPASSGPTAGPVELLAPGDGVTSVSRVTGGLVIGSGGEMAAAFVAGSAALVRSYRPELGAADVKERLLRTAVPAADAPAGTVAGIVEPLGAVTRTLPARPAAVGSDPTPLAVSPAPPVDGALDRATVFAGVVLLLALTAALTAATLRARRRPHRPS